LFSPSCIFRCDLPSAEAAHLHIALVPFLIRTSSRKRDLLTDTIRSNLFVYKLPAVIGIESQDGKWEARLGTLEGSQDRLSPTVEQGQTFRPPVGDIGQRDRVLATALQSPSTMSDQIDRKASPVWPGPIGRRCGLGSAV
jgi:hypothetical protein